jgi:hypothetical protein
MRPTLRFLVAAVVPMAVACTSSAPGAEAADEHAAAADSTTVAAHDHEPSGAGAAEGGQALRPIMQQLATDLAGLTTRLWVDDYAGMAEPAGRIAGHTQISADELARIKAALGAEMAGFETADAAVHDAALALRAAVEAHDSDAVVARLADVQKGCVACHSTYRERLRTSP